MARKQLQHDYLTKTDDLPHGVEPSASENHNIYNNKAGVQKADSNDVNNNMNTNGNNNVVSVSVPKLDLNHLETNGIRGSDTGL